MVSKMSYTCEESDIVWVHGEFVKFVKDNPQLDRDSVFHLIGITSEDMHEIERVYNLTSPFAASPEVVDDLVEAMNNVFPSPILGAKDCPEPTDEQVAEMEAMNARAREEVEYAIDPPPPPHPLQFDFSRIKL